MALPSRRLVATLLVLAFIPASMFFIRPMHKTTSAFAASQMSSLAMDARPGDPMSDSTFHRKAACRQVNNVPLGSQCAWVHQYCGDLEGGIMSYLTLYYCTLAHAKAVASIMLVAWLSVLFTTIGIIASDFFSSNLSTIAHSLHLSDTLAGVSVLALGNGSPDIFSTFAAVTSGSTGLAIGELLGAASFIATAVAGAMALVAPFAIKRDSFVRDAVFLIATLVFVSAVLITGRMHAWQCAMMIVLYVIYVTTVMLYHWWLVRSASNLQHTRSLRRANAGNDHADEEARQVGETRPLLSPSSTAMGEHDQQNSQDDKASVLLSGAYYSAIASWQFGATHTKRSARAYHLQPSLLGALHHQRHHESMLETRIVEPSIRRPPSAAELANNSPNLLAPSEVLVSIRSEARHAISILLPSLQDIQSQGFWHLIVNITTAPSMLVLKLTTPVVQHPNDEDSTKASVTIPPGQTRDGPPSPWDRWLLIVQLLAAPQFVNVVFWLRSRNRSSPQLIHAGLYILGGSIALIVLLLLTSSSTRRPRWLPLLSAAGFVMSAFWLDTIASEVVAVLKAVGVIANISEQILGYTVFAVGNSVDDLVANIMVARDGHPVMAFAACFGGPLANILIGLGIAGLYVTIRDGTPVELDVGTQLLVIPAVLVVTLMSLMAMMWWRDWFMSRAIGCGLIAVWIAVTIANVVLVVKG